MSNLTYRIFSSSISETMERVHAVVRNLDKAVLVEEHTDSIYDCIRDLTQSEEQGGELEDHDLVAFSSSLGDGFFDVIATIVELPNGEKLISKIEIELVSKEELEEWIAVTDES